MNEQTLKDRIRVTAAKNNVSFNYCWKRLLLERFLARISLSPYRDKLIFKGGFLLSYLLKIGRETIDLDFLLRQIDAEETKLRHVFEEIASVRLEDGFVFHLVKIKSLIQRHMLYPGFRVFLSATFGKIRDQIRIDLGIGDLVEPIEREIPQVKFQNRPLYQGDIFLKTYPIETIFSEKFETVISKGSINSRMKDYHDLFVILKNRERLNTEKLRKQVHKTFTKRNTALGPVNFSDQGLESLQKLWSAHYLSVANLATELDLPKIIEEIINEVNAFLASNLR